MALVCYETKSVKKIMSEDVLRKLRNKRYR